MQIENIVGIAGLADDDPPPLFKRGGPRQFVGPFAQDRTHQLDVFIGILPEPLGKPLAHRIDHILSGVQAQIAIKVVGTDLQVLRQAAGRVAEITGEVPGVIDLYIEPQVLVPQLHISMNRERLAEVGLSPGQLAHELETAVGGTVTGSILEGERSFDLHVRLESPARDSIKTLGRLPISLIRYDAGGGRPGVALLGVRAHSSGGVSPRDAAWSGVVSCPHRLVHLWPARAGASASAAIEGKKSTLVIGVSQVVPAGIVPVHRMQVGTRTPASKTDPFCPRSGSSTDTLGSPPLSLLKITSVFSASPSSSIFATTRPTLTSTASIIPA